MGGNIGLADPVAGAADAQRPGRGRLCSGAFSFQIDLTQTLDCDVSCCLTSRPIISTVMKAWTIMPRPRRGCSPCSRPIMWRWWPPRDVYTRAIAGQLTGEARPGLCCGRAGTSPPGVVQGPPMPECRSAVAVARAHRRCGRDDRARLATYTGLPHRMEGSQKRAASWCVIRFQGDQPDVHAPALAAYPAVH
jgi:UDP-N-acetylmuramoylalanine--D-glutamate ligase